MKLLEFLTSRCLLDVFGMHSGCVRDEGAKRNRGSTSQVPPMYVPSKSHFLQREWEDDGRGREKSVIVAYARMLRNNNHREIV